MKEIAILFDMDGVIVDNHKIHIQAWKVFGERKNFSITDEDVYGFFGNTNNEILKMIMGNQLSSEEMIKLAREKEMIYREIFEKTIKPVDGLPELLGNLKKEHINTAVATAGPEENLTFVLKKTGLTSYFDILVHDSMVTNGKPDPEIYLMAADKLNIPPKNCLVFEDAVHGIASGKKAGMKVVALTTTYTKDKLLKADKIIKNFNEIDIRTIKKMVS